MPPPSEAKVITVNANLVLSLAPSLQEQLDRIEKAVSSLLRLRLTETSTSALTDAVTPRTPTP